MNARDGDSSVLLVPSREAAVAMLEEAKRFEYRTRAIARVVDRWFDPDSRFERHHIDICLPAARIFNALMSKWQGEPEGLELRHSRLKLWAVVLRDASEPGKWRAQMFDRRGFSGHFALESAAAVLEQVITEGYVEEDAGVLDELSTTDTWAEGMALAEEDGRRAAKWVGMKVGAHTAAVQSGL